MGASKRLAGGAAALALLLGSAIATTAYAQDLHVIDVTARAGKLIPVHIEVPAGVKIKIQLRNEGPEPMEFESTALRIEKVLSPGANSFVIISPLKPGTYTFIDEFHVETGLLELVAR